MPCQRRASSVTVSWWFYFAHLSKDQTTTSARIMPQSIRPHLWQSLTHARSTCFSWDFIPLFLAGLITGILHGRELTPSAGPLRGWFSGHWASGSLPSYHSAGPVLWPKACCHRRQEVSPFSKKPVCLSGDVWLRVILSNSEGLFFTEAEEVSLDNALIVCGSQANAQGVHRWCSAPEKTELFREFWWICHRCIWMLCLSKERAVCFVWTFIAWGVSLRTLMKQFFVCLFTSALDCPQGTFFQLYFPS